MDDKIVETPAEEFAQTYFEELGTDVHLKHRSTVIKEAVDDYGQFYGTTRVERICLTALFRKICFKIYGKTQPRQRREARRLLKQYRPKS